jgi:hypothetical protein
VGYSGRRSCGQRVCIQHTKTCASPRLTIWKYYVQLEQSTLPNRFLLARNATLPSLEVELASGEASRARVEAKRMVAAPLLPAYMSAQLIAIGLGAGCDKPLLLKSVLAQGHVFGASVDDSVGSMKSSDREIPHSVFWRPVFSKACEAVW